MIESLNRVMKGRDISMKVKKGIRSSIPSGFICIRDVYVELLIQPLQMKDACICVKMGWGEQ